MQKNKQICYKCSLMAVCFLLGLFRIRLSPLFNQYIYFFHFSHAWLCKQQQYQRCQCMAELLAPFICDSGLSEHSWSFSVSVYPVPTALLIIVKLLPRCKWYKSMFYLFVSQMDFSSECQNLNLLQGCRSTPISCFHLCLLWVGVVATTDSYYCSRNREAIFLVGMFPSLNLM